MAVDWGDFQRFPNDLERCIRIYFKRTPYSSFIELDPDGIHEHHKFRLGKPFPDSPTKHTVHVVEDLRAALELTAIAVARLVNLPVERVHFPFSKTAADFKSRIGDCCKGFPEEITRPGAPGLASETWERTNFCSSLHPERPALQMISLSKRTMTE